MAGAPEPSRLLALPDHCLLLVLQCCAADNHRSLFSAARAHSRLHQAAVVALRSITVKGTKQQQTDGVMVYLRQHGQHVHSLELTAPDHIYPQASLRQLPQQLQLSSLQLQHFFLQLQPGNGSQGVLGAAAVTALKQLRLHACELIDSDAAAGWAAALSQLPAGLEHLSIGSLYTDGGQGCVQFPAGVLQQLPHLTYLELAWIDIVGPDEDSHPLQPLQALPRLAVLKLEYLPVVITCSMLSGMQHLTRLELSHDVSLEPGALAGITQLQQLCLSCCRIVEGEAGVAQLLSHLQPLQQLTHLSLYASLWAVEGSSPPASAYAALTASSKLQHLNIQHCRLPAGVWQHVFSAGRRLPNLQSLNIESVKQPSGEYAPAPEGSRLASCCPGLQFLRMVFLQCSAELLAPLQGLSGLHTLHCGWVDLATAEVVQAVCQLTRLRELGLWGAAHLKQEGSLLHLTHLKQLSTINFYGVSPGGFWARADEIHLPGGDEPMWWQMARLHLNHPNPAVAQQAAAALAETQ